MRRYFSRKNGRKRDSTLRKEDASWGTRPLPKRRFCSFQNRLGGQLNDAETSLAVILRTGGKEKLIGSAVHRRTLSEVESPQLVNHDFAAMCILHRAKELSSRGIKGVDHSVWQVVAHEECIAEFAEVGGCQGKSPRLIQGTIRNQALDEVTEFVEHVDHPARNIGRTREGNEHLLANHAYAIRSEVAGNLGIGEREYGVKLAVVDVDLAAGGICSIDPVDVRCDG